MKKAEHLKAITAMRARNAEQIRHIQEAHAQEVTRLNLVIERQAADNEFLRNALAEAQQDYRTAMEELA